MRSFWRVTVAHDKGIVTFRVLADSKPRAAAIIMLAEKCPLNAILHVAKIKEGVR